VTSSTHADVVVVGLGAMGAATLYQLAKRGVLAIGVDRFDPPHTRGSSHGESRITRQAVGEGADYVPLAIRSHAIWRDLEAATGERLYVDCGCLVLGPEHGATAMHDQPSFLRATIALADRFAIAHERLDGQALARRFPQFTRLSDDTIGYFEPGGGFVHPEACIRAQLAQAERLGARVMRNNDTLRLEQRGDEVQVTTATGTITAKRAVVAAGAWAARLLGAPFDGLLRVTRQTLYWFAPADTDLYSAARPCPVYIWMHGPSDDDYFYGFPTPVGATGVKVATEQYATIVDPDSSGAAPDAAHVARFYAKHIDGRLRDVTPALVKAVTCLYTSTRGSRFIIAAHPRSPAITVISGCSGHGFKHSAAIGELVATHLHAGTSLPRAFAI
jgi:sarcosine oxidase